MRLALTPIRDLEADGDRWQSTGTDPGFLIRLPVLRRHSTLLVCIESSVAVRPQLYVGFGKGFAEKRSITASSGTRHCILVDIGWLGPLQALRLDPAMEPCTLSCTVEGFLTAKKADEAAAAWASGQPTVRSRFGGLNRMWLTAVGAKGPKWTLRKHLQHIYGKVERETRDVVPPKGEPWLSIVVPVYNTPVAYLDELFRSVASQNCGTIELIFSDDGSTTPGTRKWLEARRRSGLAKVASADRNRGIAAASNAALALASGEWVTLLDHDDVLAPRALAVVAQALHERPDTQFLYTDEVVTDVALKPTGLMAKPGYDPVLLTGVNYINHASFYRRERLEAIGGFREGFDGSQDYDMLLRYLEGIDDGLVVHLPYPAYWWRRDGKTYSRTNIDPATAKARRAIGEHMERIGLPAEVKPAITPTLHRIVFADAPKAKVSIIIPNRNAFALIDRLLADLYGRTAYSAFEVIVVDNGTTDPQVLALYERYAAEHNSFRYSIQPERFNFSRAINRGIAMSTGEHHLLLNNDVSVIEPDWLDEMVSCLSFPNVGIVGAKLLFPNDTIQHAGVIAGFGGLAGHWYLNKPRDFGGPLNRLHLRFSVTCVTGAAMLISGECQRRIGLLDEENFAVAYNDVDYCLRAYKAGYRIVWTPYAALHHYESASRGSDKTESNRARFEQEKNNLRRIHGTSDFLDPASSPHYARAHSTPELAMPGWRLQPRCWFPE
jgi:GT2 family glycosyltransferase